MKNSWNQSSNLFIFPFDASKKKKKSTVVRYVLYHTRGEIKNASDGILALGSGSLTPTSDEPTSKNRRPDVKLYSEPDTGAVHRLLNRLHRNSTGEGKQWNSLAGIRPIRSEKENLDSTRGELLREKFKIWNVVKLYI